MGDEMEMQFGNNGHSDVAEDFYDRAKRMSQQQDGIGGNLSSSNLSLMKMMLTIPEEYKRLGFWLICEFLDEDEARDMVNAYHEALDLGMSTEWNVSTIFALAASHRQYKGQNRVSELLGSMSSFRYFSNQPQQDKKHGDKKSAL